MTKQIIEQPATLEIYSRFGISEAVRTGSTIYISGQVGWDESLQPAKSFDEQVRLAFQNMASMT